ncbi:hypothetical protein VOLCADRAFT_127337 [Volvox carteri f. nagariensis]|uniref:Peroxiredoxin-like 2A n=1 Tax=Volvox carteri f. nagariensis TaxID=3068 RepID=D8THW6_VOLCA|nr:uncharacterized protein VOLCADRAFT_127337 [Volvox carteri f. nagariensis]EFJ52787.1 hypothetical protein VOLCADRAFT_127337 [Volvox carteri f. nagariensis]|eukprot:XP_002945792.1 hypothetical protein VOLCADRAFT_127337 [Volvox carteri f. nagariensis]
MAARGLPSISSIANAVLRSRDGAEVVASTLWQSQPLAVLILRRPGCVLCRDEAQRLWKLKPEFERMGVGLVCVVHEWIPREVNAFTSGFWPGPLYHDPSKAFYAALNGGNPLRGSIWGLLFPWSAVWRRIRTASRNVPEHNIVGDGFTMGGAMVLRRGGGGGGGCDIGSVAWMHVERDIGLVADPAAVLAAAREVAETPQGGGGGGEPPAPAPAPAPDQMKTRSQDADGEVPQQ